MRKNWEKSKGEKQFEEILALAITLVLVHPGIRRLNMLGTIQYLRRVRGKKLFLHEELECIFLSISEG